MLRTARNLLFRIAVLAPLLAFVAPAQTGSVLDFLHVSDTHVMDLGGVHPKIAAARKHYEPSAAAFTEFLESVARERRPAFVLHTGDLIDAYSFAGADREIVYRQVDRFRQIHDRSPLPLFLTLGNHDINHYGLAGEKEGIVADQSVAGRARADWIRASGSFRDGTYYSFERKVGATRYVFLVLDNGYYGADPGSLGGGGVRQFDLERAQLQWLRRQAAAHRDDVVILAMHVPLGSDAASQAIKEAVAGCHKLPLVLAGHIHSESIEEIQIGSNRALQVRTGAFAQSPDNWRLIRLREDRIELSAVGKPEQVVRTIGVLQPVHAGP